MTGRARPLEVGVLFWIDILIVVLGSFLPSAVIILMVTPPIMPGLLAHGFDSIGFGINMNHHADVTDPSALGVNLSAI